MGGKSAPAPTRIAVAEISGGELWLAGLPTEQNKGRFAKTHLQVRCFGEGPERRGGCKLPGAPLRMEIAGYERSGTGTRSGPSPARDATAALMYALLHETSWEQAVAHIEARRPEVDFAGFMRNKKARCCALRGREVSFPGRATWPLSYTWLATKLESRCVSTAKPLSEQ